MKAKAYELTLRDPRTGQIILNETIPWETWGAYSHVNEHGIELLKIVPVGPFTAEDQ